MEIGVQRTARPTQIGARSRVQVGRVTPCAPTRDHKPSITYTGDRSPEISGRAKSRAWEEAWGAALPLASTWALALVAAWPLPTLSRWDWLSEWQWASALVFPLLPRQRYRPDPNRRRCLVGPRLRIESKRYAQLSCSKHRGSR